MLLTVNRGELVLLIFTLYKCNAISWNWLELAGTGWNWLQLAATGCNWLQLAATGCNWLQLAATGCNWLQLAATGCNWLQRTIWKPCSTGGNVFSPCDRSTSQKLMPPLIQKWNELKDEDKDLFPLLEVSC